MFDLFNQPDLPIHSHERSETESYFQENKKKFSANLQKTFDLLMDGVILTHYDCINTYRIGSLSSRISELKRANFPASKDWLYSDGKRLIRKYFYTAEQIETYKIRYKIQMQ